MRVMSPGFVLSTLMIAALPATASKSLDPAGTLGRAGTPPGSRSAVVVVPGASTLELRGADLIGARRCGTRDLELLGTEGRVLVKLAHPSGLALRVLTRDGEAAAMEAVAAPAGEHDPDAASFTWSSESGAEIQLWSSEGTPIEIAGSPSMALSPATEGAAGPKTWDLSLLPNLPNPFRARTAIRYVLPSRGHVNIEVFDIAGRRVASLLDREQSAGPGSVDFEPRARGAARYEVRLKFVSAEGAAARSTSRSILHLQ